MSNEIDDKLPPFAMTNGEDREPTIGELIAWVRNHLPGYECDVIVGPGTEQGQREWLRRLEEPCERLPKS